MTNQQIARIWSISEVNGNAKLMKYAPEALYNYGPSGWQAAQWKEEKESLMYGERKGEITTSPTQLGITSGSAAPVTSKTPESRIGGELEITPDVLTARNGDYAIMVRTKDKDGIEAVQPFYDSYGRPMRWKPSLEEWAPYKKCRKSVKNTIVMSCSAVRTFAGSKINTVRSTNNISACTTSVWTGLKITFRGALNNAGIRHS